MENRSKSILGLLDGGKRVYKVKEGEVDADQFEYCAVLTQILFGPKGLVETLGPTWEMVHDPRFEKIENLFIIQHKSMFGGDAREGVQVQTADGTFTGSFAGLQQYAEMLGEGRYLIKILQNLQVIEVLNDHFAGREFAIPARDSLGALKLLDKYPGALRLDLVNAIYNSYEKSLRTPEVYAKLESLSIEELWVETFDLNFFSSRGFLSPDEQQKVRELMPTYSQYNPHAVQDWPEMRIWGLIKLEYTNYFSRKGEPNREAKTLFAIIKGGLLGLVSDYAEEANLQETVLLEDPNQLYEPEKHGEDAYRVAMEVEYLERALSYRAELRVTAAQILNSLGIASRIPDLTDFERDQVLKIIYQSKWPLDKTTMITNILQFTYQISLSGKTVQEREFEQLTAASISAKKYVAGLKDGSILPINRETDGQVETEGTTEELLMEKILGNPLFAHLLLRYTNLEKRLFQAKTAFLLPYSPRSEKDLLALLTSPTDVLEEDKTSYPSFGKMFRLVEHWTSPVVSDNAIEIYPPQASEVQLAQLSEIGRLSRAIQVLSPAFSDLDFNLTEETALELFQKVEEIDPTPKKEIAEYEGTNDEENRILPPVVQ